MRVFCVWRRRVEERRCTKSVHETLSFSHEASKPLLFWFLLAVLDQNLKESLGSVAGKGAEKDHAKSHTGTDEEEADKLEEKDTSVPLETDHLEQASTKDAFTKTIEEMKVSCLLFFVPHFPRVI